MKNKEISKERKKYINKSRRSKLLVILTQILILVRIFNNLGNACKCKYNR